MSQPPAPINPEQRIPMASNPETLTAEEITDTVERGGPFITIEFTSNDGFFKLTRVMGIDEVQDFHSSLGEEIANARELYNIQPKE